MHLSMTSASSPIAGTEGHFGWGLILIFAPSDVITSLGAKIRISTGMILTHVALNSNATCTSN